MSCRQQKIITACNEQGLRDVREQRLFIFIDQLTQKGEMGIEAIMQERGTVDYILHGFDLGATQIWNQNPKLASSMNLPQQREGLAKLLTNRYLAVVMHDDYIHQVLPGIKARESYLT